MLLRGSTTVPRPSYTLVPMTTSWDKCMRPMFGWWEALRIRSIGWEQSR
jgi:hypothetical protein